MCCCAAAQVAATPAYVSPELAGGCSLNARASDVWAFGCTVLELVSGDAPWSAFGLSTAKALTRHIAKSDKGPTLPRSLSPELRDFLQRCLFVDQHGRAACSLLLCHPWLAEPTEAPVNKSLRRKRGSSKAHHGGTAAGKKQPQHDAAQLRQQWLQMVKG